MRLLWLYHFLLFLFFISPFNLQHPLILQPPPGQLLHFAMAAKLPSPLPNNSTSTRHSTTTTPAIPTPTLIIPPGCHNCYGPTPLNSSLTCYQNTQCVPRQYLCNNLNNTCTTTTTSTDQTTSATTTNTVDCLDSICYDHQYLPVPAPVPNIPMLRSSDDDCLAGNFVALDRTDSPKYVFSCVFKSPGSSSSKSGVSCNDWEYAYQGSCFLRTCGGSSTTNNNNNNNDDDDEEEDWLTCLPGFVCSKEKETDIYGLCRGENDPTGGNTPYGSSDGIEDGSAGQYSSREYLLQGLLIGICSLVLGVGMGVGFWHYRTKKQKKRHSSHHHRRTASGHSYSSHRSRALSHSRIQQSNLHPSVSTDDVAVGALESSRGGAASVTSTEVREANEGGQGDSTTTTTSERVLSNTEEAFSPVHRQPSSSSSLKSTSWISNVFSCGKKRQSRRDNSHGAYMGNPQQRRRRQHFNVFSRNTDHHRHQQRNSYLDTESQDEDESDTLSMREGRGGEYRSSNIFVTARWRWGPGAGSQLNNNNINNRSTQMMLSRGSSGINGLGIIGTLPPEMIDPPPLYQNEPDLPSYYPSQEDANVMSNIQSSRIRSRPSEGTLGDDDNNDPQITVVTHDTSVAMDAPGLQQTQPQLSEQTDDNNHRDEEGDDDGLVVVGNINRISEDSRILTPAAAASTATQHFSPPPPRGIISQSQQNTPPLPEMPSLQPVTQTYGISEPEPAHIPNKA